MGVSAAPMQIGQYRCPHVGAGQPGRWLKAVKNGKSRGGSLPLRNGYRTVQPVYRGRRDPLQQRVTLHHLVPASLVKRGGEAVFRRDPGLGVVPGEDIALCGSGQPYQPNLNLLAVPEMPVLLLQQEQSTGSVLASSHPCRVQMHQSQQRKRFRSLAYRMFRQDGSQPYRFVAKLPADDRLRVGRKVALREHKVENFTYGWQSR